MTAAAAVVCWLTGKKPSKYQMQAGSGRYQLFSSSVKNNSSCGKVLLSRCNPILFWHGFVNIFRIKIKTMRRILISVVATAILATVIFIACQKENNSQNTTLKVRLTDNPINAEEVNVDILQVRVNFRDDSTGWVDLNTNAGIYNLLGLQNGVDTLLATGTVPSGLVKEIRLVLGTDNSIKVSGVVFPLTVPSGSASGLKIKVNKQLSGSIDSLLIDFDAALSVHQTGGGDYMLKPVLKIK